MKCKLSTKIAICAALAVSLLGAQTAGSPPAPPSPAQRVADQVSHLTALLSLTPAQQTQATAIFTDQQSAISDVMSSMRTVRAALDAAVESNDAGAITAQATQIGSLTAQETESRAKADAAFYAILTSDQQTKFKQVGHGGPGRGGPRGLLPPGMPMR